MKTVQIKLETPKGTYVSNISDPLDEDGIKEFTNLIEKVAGGKVDYFKMEFDGNQYYFGEEVLKKSIITLIIK